jgi:hypothetical protein
MTKELFVETIEALQKQYEHDAECSKAFKTILPNDYTSSYDNHWLTNQLVKLLQIAMNDENEDSWIEYYLWELDFGKKYKDGCASYKDGRIIDISTPEKLYDFLKEYNKCNIG